MRFNYMFFLIYNHFYKDGNHAPSDTPKSEAMFILLLYEFIILFTIDKFISLALGISLIDKLISFFGNDIFSSKLAFLIIFLFLYPINYKLLVKTRFFDNIYDRYKDSDFNTKKNRIIYLIFIVISFPGIIALGLNLKYLFSLW